MSHPGDALTWRRLNLATRTPGDASPWRRLPLATPYAVNLLTSFPWAPFEGSHHTLTLTLVNARGWDGTQGPQS